MIQLNKILSDYSQVESALAMRTLQPQVKAIQQQYAGDQVFYLAFITVTFLLISPLLVVEFLVWI